MAKANSAAAAAATPTNSKGGGDVRKNGAAAQKFKRAFRKGAKVAGGAGKAAKVAAAPKKEKAMLPPKSGADVSANWKRLLAEQPSVASAATAKSSGKAGKKNGEKGKAKQPAKKAAKRDVRAIVDKVVQEAADGDDEWFKEDATAAEAGGAGEGAAAAAAAGAASPNDAAATAAAASKKGQPKTHLPPPAPAPRRPPALVTGQFTGPTKFLGIDCEMVGVGADGVQSALARVSIVNSHGHVQVDTFVRAQEKVTDYRTHVSGVRPEDIRDAPTFAEVQKQVSDLCLSRVLVGHDMKHDLDALLLPHPRSLRRDTAQFKPFRSLTKGRTPGLKRLAKYFLGMDIQEGEHSSVTDAQVTMLLYKKHAKEWEKSMQQKRFKNKGGVGGVEKARR